jgi:hypothetical protein
MSDLMYQHINGDLVFNFSIRFESLFLNNLPNRLSLKQKKK